MLAAMSRAKATGKQARRTVHHPVWSSALALVVVLLVASVWVLRHPPRPDPAGVRPPTMQLNRTVDLLENQLSKANGEALLALSQRMEQPLETEMRLVMNDARTAVNALANHFLPDSMRQVLRKKTSE
jgi:hypothetical protein